MDEPAGQKPRGRGRNKPKPAQQPAPGPPKAPSSSTSSGPTSSSSHAPAVGRGKPKPGTSAQAQASTSSGPTSSSSHATAVGRGKPKPGTSAQAQASTSSGPTSSSSHALAVGRGKPKPGTSAQAQALPTKEMGALSVSGGAAGSSGGGNGNGGNGNGNGNGDGPHGRYGIRGGRSLHERIQLLHSRPDNFKDAKTGSSGQKTLFQANAFALTKKPKFSLNKYHVDFNPAEDRTRMRKIFLREHRNNLGQYLFDGSTIYSSHNLNPNNRPVEYISKRLSDEANIRITIKFVGTTEESDPEYAQVLNVIMRECQKHMNLTLIKRNYFDKDARVTLREHNLELWPGYITVMGQFERDFLFQVEIIYKTLRSDSAYHLFREIAQNPGPMGFKAAFSSAIIGTTVMTKYNDKTYKISDVNYNETPENTFPQKTRDGIRHISYKDYYQQRYNATITDPNQPMLVSKLSARERRQNNPDMPEFVYLVPELCTMTGLNDNMRSNYQLMRQVAEHTSVAPTDRIRRLQNWRERLVTIPEVKTKLESWGLGLSDKLVQIEGRILPQENIVLGNNIRHESGADVDWTKHLRSSPMLVIAELRQWAIIYPSKLQQEAQDLTRMLQNCGKGMSFMVPPPQPYAIQNDGAAAYVHAIDDVVNKYNPQLIVFVVPNNRSDRYSAIKKKTIVDKSVPSQVVLLKNIRAKSAMSIATKITIQINCKIGGAPWGVDNPMKLGMVIGFDVCHDPRERCRSYGAMVSSIDGTLGRYYSTVSLHASGNELSSSFSINITKAVQRYRQVNEDRLPSPILMYRDGVGDGDLENVYNIEIEDIRNALEPIYKSKGTPLRLAVIIVTKRINTRIFQNGRNPQPGTIIDDVITNPHRFDFFIVSQSVRQGTVSPTHYNVIHDTTNYPVDNFQRLTYKLTHMYYNWSGTVRVPAPCQYAHKLAFLTSQSIGCQHANLDQLLYFL